MGQRRSDCLVPFGRSGHLKSIPACMNPEIGRECANCPSGVLDMSKGQQPGNEDEIATAPAKVEGVKMQAAGRVALLSPQN